MTILEALSKFLEGATLLKLLDNKKYITYDIEEKVWWCMGRDLRRK